MLNVEEVKLINKPNEHGYLYVKCLIDDSIEFKYSIEASTDDNIILNEILYDENKTIEKNILFNGIIENVRTTNIDKIYYLEIEALTSSSLLDIEQKSRSFQDEKMSYDDVIYEILKDYKGFGFGQCMSMPMRIEKPIFQYKETDYEFLKRIASHLGLELVSDIINMTNMFYFGKPKGKSYNIPDVHEYKATKNIDMYNKMVVFDENLHNTDYFYYEVKLRQSMKIGDLVKFKNRDFYVYKYEAEYIQGELIYKYRFCRQKGIWQEKIYNKKFSGMSLEGTVLETTGEILKLKLNIDEKQDINKAAWFVFAPPTGNIFYSMPLVGDNVMLYFQNEYDRPVVTGCVRKNGDTFGRCSNPDNRYYATESGNYLDMLPGAVNLYRGGMHVCFNDENGISMHSDTSISVEAPGSVTMDAETVFIKGNTKLFISKAKSGFLSFEGDLYNQAGIVYENGSCMEVFPPCEDGILDLNSPFGMNGDQGSKFNPTMDLVSAMAGSIPKSCASNTSDMPNYFLNDNLNKINPTGEVYTTNSHEISTTDKILDLLGIQTCCYAATRDDATKDEESQNTNNNSNQYSVEKLNDDISMSNDPIYSMGKNNIKKLNPSSEEIEIKGEGSYIRQDTGNKIPADSIEYFSSSAQYKPGDLVKIKGTNGNTIFGTAQEDGYIGTGAYKTYKFVPYNKEEYDKAISVGNTDLYKACKENEDLIKGIVSFAIDNTPIV